MFSVQERKITIREEMNESKRAECRDNKRARQARVKGEKAIMN